MPGDEPFTAARRLAACQNARDEIGGAPGFQEGGEIGLEGPVEKSGRGLPFNF